MKRKYNWRLAALVLVLATSCSSGTDSLELGALDQEIAYAQSSGHNQVVVSSLAIQNVGVALTINGERQIVLNPSFLGQPPLVQTFFRYHELGHHYFDHRVPGGCQYHEYEADAFAIRVMARSEGENAARSVIAWFQSLTAQAPSICIANSSHPACTARAAYMESVLAAVLPVIAGSSGADSVPAIPVAAGSCTGPQTAQILAINTTSLVLEVGINGGLTGAVLQPGQCALIPVTPGSYVVDLVGICAGPLGPFLCSFVKFGGAASRSDYLTNAPGIQAFFSSGCI